MRLRDRPGQFGRRRRRYQQVRGVLATAPLKPDLDQLAAGDQLVDLGLKLGGVDAPADPGAQTHPPDKTAAVHHDLPDAPAVRVYGPQPHALLGSAHITGGELIADRLLSPAEVAGLIESTP